MNIYIWGYAAVAVGVLISLAVMRWQTIRYVKSLRASHLITPPIWALFILSALWLPAVIVISFAAFRRAFDFDWTR